MLMRKGYVFVKEEKATHLICPASTIHVSIGTHTSSYFVQISSQRLPASKSIGLDFVLVTVLYSKHAICVILLWGPDAIFLEKESYMPSCREGIIIKEFVHWIDLHSWKLDSSTMATCLLKTDNSGSCWISDTETLEQGGPVMHPRPRLKAVWRFTGVSPCWKVREKLESNVHSWRQQRRGAHSGRVGLAWAGRLVSSYLTVNKRNILSKFG